MHYYNHARFKPLTLLTVALSTVVFPSTSCSVVFIVLFTTFIHAFVMQFIINENANEQKPIDRF